MKKLILILSLVLLTSTLFAQEKSNYEKYWQAREDSIANSQTTLSSVTTKNQTIEYDDLYYQPSVNGKKIKYVEHNNMNTVIDTIVNNNPNVTINYYENDPFLYSYNIGRFYHSGFNYWMYNNSFYYDNYWMYDSYNWRFMNYPYWNYPYYGFYFGYSNRWYTPYYYHNNYHNNYYSNNQNVRYGRRERPSNFQTENRRISVQQSQNRRTIGTPNKSTYQESRRTYAPTYSTPRMRTRPEYNNSKTINNMPERRAVTSTQSRTLNIHRSTQTRSYSTPNRNYNVAPSRAQSTAPSRNYSQPSGFGRTFNFNSGNASRGSINSNVSRSSGGSKGSSSGRR